MQVSKFTGVPESEVYGVATFYTQFPIFSYWKKIFNGMVFLCLTF
ncbi:hypothetical protein [Methanobacterium sp. SMA-27]